MNILTLDTSEDKLKAAGVEPLQLFHTQDKINKDD